MRGKRTVIRRLKSALRNHKIESLPVGTLKPHPDNARTHSKKQIEQIADSIREFGFTNPPLIDAENRILAGHGRVEAAKLLGVKTIPVIRIEGLSEAQLRAYVIADNRIGELAGWDRRLLALELQYIQELEVDFDLTITGLETAEIDILLEGTGSEGDPAADALPDTDPAEPPVTRPGDLWRLGPHRLLCGDATQRASFQKLMGDRKAQMVLSDPPYNVPIDGHASGLGAIHHPNFLMASGEMSEEQFTDFLRTVCNLLVEFSVDGSIHYLFMDFRHVYELLTAGRSVYSEFKNLVIWNKSNAGMGSFYRSKHELILVFKNGSRPHVNNFELGQHGRHRSNVWDYPGANAFGGDRSETLRMHPTVKPVALVADAIKDCSKRGGIVLDCFAGSGSILIGAQKTGRKAYAMELEPKYVDMALRRWEDYAGGEATHEETGMSFSGLKEERADGR